jgi:hypothetical protein
MIRDFPAGRVRVDASAFVSMSAALLLGETLAGIVVAVMYAGGTGLGNTRNACHSTQPRYASELRYALSDASGGVDLDQSALRGRLDKRNAW